MTPLQIEILLHYYTSPGDYKNLDAPSVTDAIVGFLNAGILTEAPKGDKQSYYGNRGMLQVYVEALCSVKLPTMKYIIEETK